jgi:hypothetical protein
MLDLREIILFDSQSTMDLICNLDLVNKIFRSSTEMQLKCNGGSMTVNYKAIWLVITEMYGMTRRPSPTYLA